MKTYGAMLAFMVILFFVLVTTAQIKPAVILKTPIDIQMLDGYEYEARRGIDSFVGAIKRRDGFVINHDIGRMAGNYSYQYFPEHFEMLRKQTHLNTGAIERQVKSLQDQVVWRQSQRVNGEEVMIVLLKDSRLIASFVGSNANFISNADSSDKIADFLLTVLTFKPKPKDITK